MSTRTEREQAVKQMNANFALEGFTPDATDIALQRGYIEGTVTIGDLLENARQFAEKARR